MRALLGDPRTVFLLVTAPERRPIDEAVFFWRKLVEAELPFGGVIVNKVHPTILGDDRHRSETALHRAATGQLADAGLPAELAGRVADAFIAYQALADRDRENVRMLTRRLGPQPLLEIPFLDEDVHDVAGLERLDEFSSRMRANALGYRKPVRRLVAPEVWCRRGRLRPSMSR